jgi:AcrR family transcriptional regulator
MTRALADADDNEAVWRGRAMSRSLDAARARAEQRTQRLIDAAFSLIDERGTTEFTIQEVVLRANLSLRSFYEYFGSKDELVLALFEEVVREADEDILRAVDLPTDPLDKLRAFVICLHEWCDPVDAPRVRGSHNRRAIAEFSMLLAMNHAARIRAALEPQTRRLRHLLDDAVLAGAVHPTDVRRTAAILQQVVMFSWFGNRLTENPTQRLTADEILEFCLYGLAGP